jgi:hypothetical protein
MKRLKELEKENGRLRKAVSDLTLEKLILKEAASGTEPARLVRRWRRAATGCARARNLRAA